LENSAFNTKQHQTAILNAVCTLYSSWTLWSGVNLSNYCAEDHHDTEVFEKRMLFFSADVHYDLARVFVHIEESPVRSHRSRKGSSFNISSISVVSGRSMGREFPGLNKFPIIPAIPPMAGCSPRDSSFRGSCHSSGNVLREVGFSFMALVDTRRFEHRSRQLEHGARRHDHENQLQLGR
jgi:hypothetical protein